MRVAHAIRQRQNRQELVNIPWAGPPHTFECIFTGHSLGGGLASAASVVANLPAITFNAAGLHRNTLDNAPIDVRAEAFLRYALEKNGNGKISAYYMDYDMLSNLQDWASLLLSANIPRALGKRILLDGRYDTTVILGTLTGLVSRIAAGGITLYAGFMSHGCEELLYGFLVKEGATGSIIEDLLGQ